VSEQFDTIVIGAGVVGLAVARALAMSGREVIVLEAENRIGSITSSRNSEVIHAGLYYPVGSSKARLCVSGKHALYAYCEARAIPHRRCGKLVVAATDAETVYLEKLLRQAEANGVDDCRLISARELRVLEPALVGSAALLSPSTGIIDSHSLMEAYAVDIESHGGMVVLRTPVTGGFISSDRINLEIGGADPATLDARLVVNCAGLHAWQVSNAIVGLDTTRIPPRHLAKGSYFSLEGRAPSQRLIYPVPEPGGLGVHLTLDLAGQARFGPDVEWTNATDYAVDPSRAKSFYAAIRRYWPDLPDNALQPAYSGIRPKVSGPDGAATDFLIHGPAETGAARYVALYGIESPGLTASLAIGDEVVRLLRQAEAPPSSSTISA
jgi:L-2-hydroxyglutarate oxidase LhgO